MTNERLLRYRAGPSALRHLRTHGLDRSTVQAFVAPASGPKWLVLAGLDRALMAANIVPSTEAAPEAPRQLLAGASAGGWRVMAMTTDDPEKTHAELEHSYIHQSFARGVGRHDVTTAYRKMLEEIFTLKRRKAAITHPGVHLAVHLARVRGFLGRPLLHLFTMSAAAAGNQLTDRSQTLIFERVLMLSSPQRWSIPFDGRVAHLTAGNFLPTALATGSVPMYFDPVNAIDGAPAGRYLDGGLTDYHLRQDFLGEREGITLFPHFQKRIVPNWFDRWTKHRKPSTQATDKVLQVFPSRAFLSRLPDQRIPTRQDFIDFADDSRTRITRWLQVTRESDRLGEQLLEDIEKGRIPDLVEPMT